MEARQRILLTIVLGIFLIVFFYFITSQITKLTGFFISENEPKNDFSACLEEQDITLYINTDDVASTLRNINLVDYIKDISIMNCLRNNQLCLEKGISSFPTWTINGKTINRDISLEELKDYSGCKLIR